MKTTTLSKLLELQHFMDDRRGAPATRTEIAAGLGISKPTVAVLITAARKEGVKIRTCKLRQGARGPKALAYSVA